MTRDLDLLKSPAVSVRQELIAMESYVMAAYAGYKRVAPRGGGPCSLAP